MQRGTTAGRRVSTHRHLLLDATDGSAPQQVPLRRDLREGLFDWLEGLGVCGEGDECLAHVIIALGQIEGLGGFVDRRDGRAGECVRVLRRLLLLLE
jgi:hypothetical protein